MTELQFFAFFGLPTLVGLYGLVIAWLHFHDLKKKEHRH